MFTMEWYLIPYLISLIQIIFVSILVVTLYRVIRYHYRTGIRPLETKWLKDLKHEIIILVGLLFIVMMSTSGNVQSKRAIVPMENPALQEYRDNRTPVIIVTPTPRTETLEGFTPLKPADE